MMLDVIPDLMMIFNDGMLSRRKKTWLQHTKVSANRGYD